MKLARCEDCHKVKLLTKHSLVGGHAEGTGYVYICRPCHDLRHLIVQKRNSRSKRGSNGKLAKGTRSNKK